MSTPGPAEQFQPQLQQPLAADAGSESLPGLPSLTLIGTQAFLPALLDQIRATATSPALPLDKVIFQSILLCLIAGEKHLILRTVDEDVGLTVKLAVWTLSSIFGIPTRRLRLRPPSTLKPRRPKYKSPASDSGAFLRALFLSTGSAAEEGGETSQDEYYDGESSRHYRHSHRSSHTGKRSKYRAGGHHAYSGTAPSEYARSLSVPSNLVNMGSGASQVSSPITPVPRTTSPESMLMGSSIAQQQQQHALNYPNTINTNTNISTNTSTSTAAAASSPTILRPKPIYPAPTLSSSSTGLYPPPHAYTDPFPIPSASARSTHSKHPSHHHHYRRHSGLSMSTAASYASQTTERGGPPQLPGALVLSGLEDASESVQRTFSGVLGERRVVLGGRKGGGDGGGTAEEDEMWALPEGFLVVYVCPWSATERPALHKSLLDKFAMSTNLSVPTHIRRDFHLLHFTPVSKPLIPAHHYNNNNNNPSNTGTSTTFTFPPPKNNFKFFSHSNPGTPSPTAAMALPQTYTPPSTSTALPGAPMHRRASSHSSHSHQSYYTTHHSHGPSHAQRHYSLRSPTATEPSPLFPHPPLPQSYLKMLHTVAAQHTRIAPELELYMADIFSAAKHHPRLEGALLGRAAVKDAEALVRAGRVVGVDLTGMELLRPGAALTGDEREFGGDEEQEDDPGGSQGDEGKEEGTDNSEDEYSSALDISIHNEPLLPPSISESAPLPHAPPPIATACTSILDVSEVNIARIVPRVISHRVRLRASPEDEVLASALFGATFRPPVGLGSDAPNKADEGLDLNGEPGERNSRAESSVKAVLVQILVEV